MSLIFNKRCYDLRDFTVSIHDTSIKISAIPQDDKRIIMLSAEYAEDSVELKLILHETGVCEFHSVNSDKKQLGSHIIDSYSAAHWDNGFYQYAATNKMSKCTCNDVYRMSIIAKQDYLDMDVNFPSSIISRGVETSFSDRDNTYQMLVCIAKLIARYTFEPWECKVLDIVCPKLEVSVPVLTKTQEEYLRKEYPVAFEAYVNSDGVRDVLDMLREALVRCPE